MTTFEAKATINKPAAEVFAFLSDMNNHQQLMPENVTRWSSTDDEAQFSIQNLGNISLKIANRLQDTLSIIIVPAAQTPFNLDLRWAVTQISNQSCQAVLTISAELNMMMKMLASAPLQKLTDHQVRQLEKAL